MTWLLTLRAELLQAFTPLGVSAGGDAGLDKGALVSKVPSLRRLEPGPLHPLAGRTLGIAACRWGGVCLRVLAVCLRVRVLVAITEGERRSHAAKRHCGNEVAGVKFVFGHRHDNEDDGGCPQQDSNGTTPLRDKEPGQPHNENGNEQRS